MPRQHLASQAPAGSSVVQQLHSLAGLHARIRQGQPATVTELHLSDKDAPPGRVLHTWGSELSPAGDCLIALWTKRADPAQPWDSISAEMRGVSGAALSWSCPYPHNAAFVNVATGWSPSGGHCATLADCDAWSADRKPLLEPRTPDAIICAFDVQHHCWMHTLPVHGAVPSPEERTHRIELCDSASLPVAAALGETVDTEERVMIIFELTRPRVQLIPLEEELPCPFAWLRGSHTLAVLQAGCIAWLDVLDLSPGTHEPIWNGLPDEGGNKAAHLAAAPDGQALWVVQAVAEQCTDEPFCLSVHAVGSRAFVGSWWLGIERCGEHVLLSVARQAIAVTTAVTHVYSLSGLALGPLLYEASVYVERAAFSGEGCLLVGGVSAAGIELLDSRTGCCLANLAPQGGASRYGFEKIRWGQDPSQLQISRSQDCAAGLVFSVLQF